MADFRNTIDTLGDGAVFDSIINRSITEFKDDKVTKVRQNAFRECTALNTVDCPNVTEIGYSAFVNCTSLISVNCPNANPLSGAFNKCSALTSVSFPLATRIGDSVFADCTSLSEIYLPKVTAIDGSGFNKTAINVADFPALTYLGGYALANSPLTTLVMRSQTIATMSNVNALQNTNIAKGTGYIYIPTALIEQYRTASGWSTYANQLRELEQWTLDGTVTGELGHRVRFFNEDGTLLKSVVVRTGEVVVYDGDDPVKEGDWKFVGWSPEIVAVTGDADYVARFVSTAVVSRKLVNRTLSGDYVNDRIESVGDATFHSCRVLESVDFPLVTSVGEDAFYCCGKIKSVNLPLVTSVGKNTFRDCNSLLSINMPLVTAVTEYMFGSCKMLTNIDLPSVKSIANYGFGTCSSLVTVILRGETMVTLTNRYAFNGTPIWSGNGYVYVPKSLVESYKTATNWVGFANQIRAIEDYPEICGGVVNE